VLNTGDSLTFGFASAQRDPGVTRATFGLRLELVGSGSLLINRDTNYDETNVAVVYTATAPVGVQLALQGGGEPKGSSHGTAFGYHAETVLASVVYCQYGTRQKPLTDSSVWVTPELLTPALAAANAQWLAPVLSIFWYTTVSLIDLCAAGPPALPPVDNSTLQASADTLRKVMLALLWAQYCECLPGAPAPTPFPPNNLPAPVGIPAPPTFNCSSDDLCAALIRIQQQLSALSQIVSQDYQLDTLQQRYQLPFAYIRGATHSGLAGSGAFAVPRLVGVQVVVVARSNTEPTFSGVPDYIADLGWISILDDNGMIDEIRLTRSVQVWLPPKMATAKQLGLALRDGVVASVTELEAEP
jgi:hypothetical protein